MSNGTDEIISAFTDDETSAFEARLSVKEIVTRREQLARWERYHIIRNVLRSDGPIMVDPTFADEVMAKIEQDPSSAQPEQRRYGFVKTVGGLALAASVAVMSVLGLRALSGGAGIETGAPSVAAKSTPVQQVVTAPPPQADTKRVNPMSRARMNSYLVNHAAHAAPHSMMSHARLVGYDMNQ